MKIDYKVRQYDYNKRSGNLDAEAKGKVKSKKYFPYFYEDGKKIIFKPLSKTKPYSTPYFAYSELVWSHILHYFFDENIPLYHLAKCVGYEQEEPKYHTYGTVVESVTNESEKLVNLYEYFMKYPDAMVTDIIKDYTNYCEMYYDYSFFFESALLRQHPELATEISKQILYSILRGDQNYHYENVSFIYEGEQLKRVAMPIDHEFSSIFMYPDQRVSHLATSNKFFDYLLERESERSKMIKAILGIPNEKCNIIKNVETIVKLYPEVVTSFIASLNHMCDELKSNPIILEDHDYLEPFSSDDHEVGILRYKDKDLEAALKKESEIERVKVSVEEVNEFVNQEILDNADALKKTLENKLTML